MNFVKQTMDLNDDGHRCPSCGCNDCRELPGQKYFGKMQRRKQCTACGRVFHISPVSRAKPVVYQSVRCRCPVCGAKNPPVVSTQGEGVRVHKCKSCGHSFNSVDSESI